ncbi:MAG: trigger factor [Erysipelotrichaceae bacterium]|nr:trigger factor [Erysipelotrichaceae bacterium]MCD8574962.1 trigger factor [Erysipelotrichaceae bacterium]
MKSNWTVKEKSTGTLSVVVADEAWASAQEKAFNKLAKNVEVKGFRKGSAPKDLVRKQISDASIFNEAIDSVANEAYIYGLTEHNLNVVGRPQLDVKDISRVSVELLFEVTITPEVTLGDYKSVKVAQESVVVSDADIEAVINKTLEDYAELVIKEGEAVMGDTVVIDFEGFKEGVAFDGGKGENYPLELGSQSFIPGFEEALVGTTVGQSLDVDVTFPDNYGVAELAGQPVVFKCTVHEIKAKQLPELSDEFVVSLKKEGITTVDAYKEDVIHTLKHEKEHEAEHAFEDAVLSQVVEGSSVDIPQIMIDEETNVLFEDFKRRLESQNYNMELYSALTGQDEAFLREQMAKDAERKVRLRLVLDAIAKAENFEITPEALEEEYAGIAQMYNMEVDQVKQVLAPSVVMQEWRLKTAFDFIKTNAKA